MGTGAVHLLTPFVAMTGSIAVRRVTAVVQAATVTNKQPVINLVIELWEQVVVFVFIKSEGLFSTRRRPKWGYLNFAIV